MALLAAGIVVFSDPPFPPTTAVLGVAAR